MWRQAAEYSVLFFFHNPTLQTEAKRGRWMRWRFRKTTSHVLLRVAFVDLHVYTKNAKVTLEYIALLVLEIKRISLNIIIIIINKLIKKRKKINYKWTSLCSYGDGGVDFHEYKYT